MTPIEAYSSTLRVNPAVGKFVAGGLVVLAAAAIVLGWGSHVSDMAVAAVWVLVFAFLAAILVFIGGRERMRAVISWILIVVFAAFFLGLVDSVLQVSGRVPPTACYLRLPVELPHVCISRLTSTPTVIGGEARAGIRALPMAPERIWLVQTTPTTPSQTGPLHVQFTKAVSPDEVMAVVTALVAAGWAVEDADSGGELVARGPDTNEVRYFHADDQAAATALAEAVYAADPAAPVSVRDFSRLGGYTKPGLLELWLTQ